MSFDSLFSNATRLPSIPKIVQELINSFENPNADIYKISAKIAQEPVITAKLLRVANSAHYGLPKQVSSVQDACIIMGFPAVRTLVMASALVDSMQMPAALNKKQFWLNAFEVAGCAKWLSKMKKGSDANTAFTAGLIHTIGQLLMYSSEPALAEQVKQAIENGTSLLEAELNIFGYTHNDVGAELAKRWKFPEIINAGLKFQDDPQKATPASDMATLLYVAKHIVELDPKQINAEAFIASLPKEIIANPPVDLSLLSKALTDLPDFTGGISALLE